MNMKSTGYKRSADHVVKDIRHATRRHFSSEDNIRIVLGPPGEESIAALCRRESIAESLLQLAEGVPRGRQKAARRRRHGTRRHQ
jgi:transposase